MSFGDIPLLGILRERMSWLAARQNVLSENVANADTAGYTARDLKPVDFEALLKSQSSATNGTLRTDDPRHIRIGGTAQDFADMMAPDQTRSETGNTVSVEAEMIKVSDTQAQYQAAANLYSKALQMMRTAIGGV
jgi:flagellar basal-body rod protein FlgB